MTNIKYPLAKDTIGKDDIDSLVEWLKTYPKITMGELTPQVEEHFATWVGRTYSVFVNSGSSANLLAAYALKISGKLKNNVVVVPSLGWVTTVTPFMQFGFDIKMCGCDPDNFGMDLDKLDEICETEDPAVVIFVQPLGVLVDKEKLKALQMKYGFFLIEDACGAVGSAYANGTKAGSIGDMSTWSTFFGHQCSTGEGGFIFTDDKILYNILLSLRSHGWLRNNDKDIYNGMFELHHVDKFNQPFFFVLPGFNVRNTDMGAFLGLRQIEKLEEFANIRSQNHLKYEELLSPHFKVQYFNNGETISSISFAFLCKSPEQRKEIVNRLNEAGIENRLYSAGALYKHPFWKNHGPHRLRNYEDPTSEKVHSCGLFVPNNQAMSIEDVEYICKVILDQ